MSYTPLTINNQNLQTAQKPQVVQAPSNPERGGAALEIPKQQLEQAQAREASVEAQSASAPSAATISTIQLPKLAKEVVAAGVVMVNHNESAPPTTLGLTEKQVEDAVKKPSHLALRWIAEIAKRIWAQTKK
jgi:hypothetical protein